MSKIVVVSTFFISFLLSFWGILVYEFHTFGLPFEYTPGWNDCAKALSYSIVGGWIIFLLTYELPFKIKQNSYQKLIKGDLVTLNKELSNILEKHHDPQHIKSSLYVTISGGYKTELIIHNTYFLSILTQIRWESPCYPKPLVTFREQMIVTLHKIINHIIYLNMHYQEFLSNNQRRCFDQISIIPLKQNAIFGKLGDMSDRINIQNITLEIASALQKSIGVNFIKDLNDIKYIYTSN